MFASCTTTTADVNVVETMRKLQSNIKDLHVIIMRQNNLIKQHCDAGKRYIDENDEERAMVEARLMLNEENTRSVYVSVWEKSRMLLSEITKVSTLSACTGVFSETSADLHNLLKTNLNINDIDRTIVRLNNDLRNIKHVEKTFNIKTVFNEDRIVFPELPQSQQQTHETIILK